MNTVKFNTIKPLIDKVVYTIRHYNPESFPYLLELLDYHFGKGYPCKGRKQFGYLYKTKHLWVSWPERFGWSRIEFCPKNIDTQVLINILSNFPNVIKIPGFKPVTYQNIRSMEVAFDLKLPPYWNDKHEEVTELISNNIVCKAQKRGFFEVYRGGENQYTNDGAINGMNTFYIVSAKTRSILNLMQPKENKDGSDLKIYSKAFPREENKEQWYIRFEVKLNDSKLKSYYKKNKLELPYDLITIFDYYKNKKFTNYFEFKDVEYDKYLMLAGKYVNNNSRSGYERLCKLGIDKPVSYKIYIMKSIAKCVRSKYLKNHIYEFIHPISLKEFKARLYERFPIQ